ncbi:MAG: helix-turn-helix domain-containing protein [Pseudomonadota bacterium]
MSDQHPAGPSQTGSGAGGEYQILLDGGQLVVNGAVRRLRPKSLAVATYLIQNAGTIVGREQLARSVWPDQPVSDDSINRASAIFVGHCRAAVNGC